MVRRLIALIFVLQSLMASMASASGAEDELDRALNRGLTGNEPYAYALVKKAGESSATKRAELLDAALRVSPDSPGLYFVLAKGALPNFLQAIDYAVRGVKAYGRSFWWKRSLYGILYSGLLASLALSLAFSALIRLPRDLPLLARDIADDKRKLILVFMLVPLSALGPMFFVSWTLCLMGLYLKRADRAVAYLALALLIVSPVYLGPADLLMSAPSPELRAIVAVNEGKDNSHALDVLKDARDFESGFSYALALKREGRYEEAIAVYEEILRKRSDRRVYNNMGNAYMALGNKGAAKESYGKALEPGPAIATLYNLSQLYRDALDFKTGDGYFAEAQKADRELVSRYMAVASNNPNRFVADETLSEEDILRFAKRRPVSRLNPFTINPYAASFAGFSLIVLFLFVSGRTERRAIRCSKCSTIVGGKRKAEWGNLCGDCYRSLVQMKTLDVKDRVARLLSVNERDKRNRRINRALSFAPPGFVQIYEGRLLVGLLYLWVFLWPAMSLLLSPLFSTGLHGYPHIWLAPVCIALMALVYAVSVLSANWRFKWL